jgi:hypothetical protein
VRVPNFEATHVEMGIVEAIKGLVAVEVCSERRRRVQAVLRLQWQM